MISIKAKKTILRTLKIVSTVLICLIVLLALLLVGVRLVGLQAYTILSPSMEPKYPVGSVIYVKRIEDPSALSVGDVITFQLTSSTTGTHRIVEIVPTQEDPAGYRFRTKGDNNDDVDGALLSPSKVIGTPVMNIPYLGYVANYIQHPPGTYVAIVVSVSIILLVYIVDILSAETAQRSELPSDTNNKEENKGENP